MGFYIDESNGKLVDPSGLTEVYATTGIINVATGAATAEVSLSTLTGIVTTQPGKKFIVALTTGTQDCLYAFGAAGAGASFTGATNMIYIPQRWVKYVTLNTSDHVSFYHQQITASGNLQVSVVK